MRRRLPPFAAIRAFEAAARHLSFKEAAEELCVTPSAVSHQIKALEEFLATALFDRGGNGLSLTRTGAAYVGKLTGLLDALDESTRAVDASGGRPLRVLSTPGFAARWLVPRLEGLSIWKDIRLRVSEGAPSTDFPHNDADVVIHWADDAVPGVVVEPLMASGRFPVISPDFKRREAIESPEDLLRVTLLHDEVMDAWAEWFLAAGMDAPELPRGPVYPHCELITTAAERGQGVALAYESMISSTLEGGTLVRLFETVTLPITIYSLAYPEAQAGDPAVKTFRDWIFAEVAHEGNLAPRAQIAAE